MVVEVSCPNCEAFNCLILKDVSDDLNCMDKCWRCGEFLKR